MADGKPLEGSSNADQRFFDLVVIIACLSELAQLMEELVLHNFQEKCHFVVDE